MASPGIQMGTTTGLSSHHFFFGELFAAVYHGQENTSRMNSNSHVNKSQHSIYNLRFRCLDRSDSL